MWSEKLNLNDLRAMDSSIREIMNNHYAKYKLQLNPILYLPRHLGGRGIRNIENTYKQTKIKAAINLLQENDVRMKQVRVFDESRMRKGRSSIINDAINYANYDFDTTLTPTEESFLMTYQNNDGDIVSTNCKNKVISVIKCNNLRNMNKVIIDSTWQGVIMKTRTNDKDLVKKDCYNWLTKWKECPVNIINTVHSIFMQTIPTLTFQKYRSTRIIDNVCCRICGQQTETVKHLLSNCSQFVKVDYIRRHNRALQCVIFQLLKKFGFIEKCPPWYSQVNVKPYYNNELVSIYWDIPEYYGNDNDDVENNLSRPDAKIYFKNEKKIVVIEMSVPWIENRELKLTEKIGKYKHVIAKLKCENHGFVVQQATIIIDCLGGFSPSLKSNLKSLNFKTSVINNIIFNMQKVTVSEASAIINKFKYMTSE